MTVVVFVIGLPAEGSTAHLRTAQDPRRMPVYSTFDSALLIHNTAQCSDAASTNAECSYDLAKLKQGMILAS